MTRKRSLSVMALIGCILTASVLIQGCGDAPKQSDAELRKQFRGGPMPSNIGQLMAEQSKKAKETQAARTAEARKYMKTSPN